MLDLNGIDVRDWLIFDPTDIPRLFAQDEAIARQWTTGLTVPAVERTNERLATEVVALRNALLLPFGDRFLGFIGGEWERALEEVSMRMLDEPGHWQELPEVA